MEGLYGWAISVCAAALVCEIALMLLPDGNLRSTARFAFGVVLLAVMAEPIAALVRGVFGA